MTIKRLPLRLLAPLLLLACTPFLWAEDGAESRFVRLSWTEDEYALRYEVVIEKEEEGEYQTVFQKFTDTCFIEGYLPPGQYRFYVVPYDYLDQPGEASQRLDFEIHPPYIPPPPPPEPVPEPVKPVERIEPPPPQPKTPSPFDLYLSAAWAPMIPIYFGEQNQFLGGRFTLAGAALRLGVFYTGLSSLNMGVELAGSWYAFNAALNGTETSLHHAVTAGVNLVVQKRPAGRRIALTFRLGAGVTFLPGSGISFQPGKSVFSNVGVSFQVFATERFYLETGIDHNHWFTDEPSGCLKPWLGIGWQL